MPKVYTVDMMEELTNNTDFVNEVETNETDEEILQRMKIKFDILDDMTRAVKHGDVRSMIVSGSPGVGKSFGVEKVLSVHDTLSNLAQDSSLKRYEIVKGKISPIEVYSKLYQFADKKSVVVFDDCDDVFGELTSLNLLKAALDSSDRRVISWNTLSKHLKAEGIPDRFEFKGGCIFITNKKLSTIRSKKLKGHFEALVSRSHCLDLSINTTREKMLRIRQVVDEGMLDKYAFGEAGQAEIINFIDENKKRMTELSLRMVIKVAQLRAAMPRTWEHVARETCMIPGK